MSFDKCTFFRPIFSVWSFGLTLGLIFSFALGGCSSSSTPRGSLSISNLEQTRSEARLAKAVEVYRTMISSTDSGVPEALLQRSQCIVIMPEVLKAAFFAGGRIGKGIATCRASDNKNDKKWTPPTFMRLSSASIGLQVGAQSTDLILFFIGDSARESLLKNNITLGADVAVAAGPVGRSAEGKTDFSKTGIYAYAQNQGLFLGASVEGASLTADRKANRAVYGSEVSHANLLNNRWRGGWLSNAKELAQLLP